MANKLIYQQVQEYVDSLVPPRPAEMQTMEAHAQEITFWIVGPAAGHLCYQLARMINARQVFELGSGYGYSTAWFAQAVRENGGGTVHHVVWDAELSRQAREHMAALGFEDTVQYHVGEAVQTLRETPGLFDLIFIDIQKDGYPAALSAATDKLRSGGVLIADNTLWKGLIFDEREQDAIVEGVREFTRRITRDPRWVASLIPIRDGLIVAYKK